MIKAKKFVFLLVLFLPVLIAGYLLLPIYQDTAQNLDQFPDTNSESITISLSESLPKIPEQAPVSTYLPEEKSMFESPRTWEISTPEDLTLPELPELRLPPPRLFYPVPTKPKSWTPIYPDIQRNSVTFSQSLLASIDELSPENSVLRTSDHPSFYYAIGDVLLKDETSDQWYYGTLLMQNDDRTWIQSLQTGKIHNLSTETHQIFLLRPRMNHCCLKRQSSSQMSSSINQLPGDLQDIARMIRAWHRGHEKRARKLSENTWLPQTFNKQLPAFWNAYRLLRSRFLIEDHDLKKAANLLVEGLQTHGDNPFIKINLGLLLKKAGHEKRAKSFLEPVQNQSGTYFPRKESAFLPNYAQGRRKLYTEKQYSLAASLFQQSLTEKHTFYPARLGLTYIRLVNHQPEKAQKSLHQYFPENEKKKILLATSYAQQKQYKRALSTLPESVNNLTNKQWKPYFLVLKGFLMGMNYQFTSARNLLKQIEAESSYREYADHLRATFQKVTKQRVFEDQFQRKHAPSPPSVLGMHWQQQTGSPTVQIHLTENESMEISGYFSNPNQFAWIAQPTNPEKFISASFEGKIVKPDRSSLSDQSSEKKSDPELLLGIGLYQFPSGKQESWGIRAGTTLSSRTFSDQKRLTAPLPSHFRSAEKQPIWEGNNKFSFRIFREQKEKNRSWVASLNGKKIPFSNVPISTDENGGKTLVYFFITAKPSRPFHIQLQRFNLYHKISK